MKRLKGSISGNGWAIAGVISAGLLLAVVLRYGLLENATQDRICSTGIGTGWCAVRAGLGWSIHYQIFGLTGLFLAMAAWLPTLRWLAYPGLVAAGCGLLIYNTTYAAVALVVALLAALQVSAPVE